MTTLRLALPESLRAAVAAVRWSGTAPRLLSPPPPGGERERARWQRLWMERRAASGASPADAEAALRNASVRALLAVWDRQADAALLDAEDGAAARSLLEPRHGVACSDYWIAGAPGDCASAFAWWSGSLEPLSRAADQLRATVDEWSRLSGGSAIAVVMELAAGDDAGRAPRARFAETVCARMSARTPKLYSPLFYRNGELQWQILLAALRPALGADPAVLCAPRLTLAQVSAAAENAGMPWAGPLYAGADVPAAELSPAAAPARVYATCGWLLRAAQAPMAALGRMK